MTERLFEGLLIRVPEKTTYMFSDLITFDSTLAYSHNALKRNEMISAITSLEDAD